MATARLLKIAGMLSLAAVCAWPQIITTIAGTYWFFPTNSLPAISAPLSNIQSVIVDPRGNVYVADRDNAIVARVSTDGILSVVAGNGNLGFSGDGGPATAAELDGPIAIALDASGNLYVLTNYDNRVRKITPGGTISTIVGDGALASGSFNNPNGIAVDNAGNLYVADTGNKRVVRIAPSGTTTIVAANTPLNEPYGVGVDSNGNVYIADTGNNRVLRITSSGAVTTILPPAGTTANAALNSPTAVTLDATGNLYITDSGNNRIVKVTPAGAASTVAGSGGYGFAGDGGSALNATLAHPYSAAPDSAGNLYIADTRNSRIRKVGANGTINTFAGNGSFDFSGDGGPATSAVLSPPTGIAVAGGNIYFADSGNNRIRRIAANGVIATVAGNGLQSFSGDGGPGTTAALDTPNGVAVDSAGNLYIADTGNNHIRKLTPTGVITTVDNNNVNAMLSDPHGLCVDAAGNLYIADTGNNRIRKLPPNGPISTVAGNGTQGFSGDGGPATSAALNNPYAVTVDSSGNLFVADTGNNRIRKITANGTISTVAGGATSGDAALSSPQAVAVDAAGDLLIADSGNNRIRKVTAAGVATTIAGTGVSGFSGDGGPAIEAELSEPAGIALDSAGNLFIADTFSHAIREVLPATAVSFKASPGSLAFAASSGGAPPQAQVISLASSVAGVAFSASASDPWLSVTPARGAVPSTLQVAVDPANLAAGTYRATITITTPNATPPQTTVAVTFTVQPSTPPKLSLSSQSLNFSVVQGTAAVTAQIGIENAGGGPLDFTTTSTTITGGDWLSASPASGTATPAAPVSLTIAAKPAGLAPGTYKGTVSVSGAGSTATVAVTLSVSASASRILLSQSGLSFTAVAQGGAPLSQSFGILNVGQGSMDWSATPSTLAGGNWLRVSPSSGTVAQPFLDVSQVNVSIDATGLSAGDYYGRIAIAANAANSPQSVTVILTVLPAGSSPGPELRPAALIFTGVAGSSPGSQDVMLANLKPQADSFSSGQIGAGFSYLPVNATVAPNQPTVLRVFPDFSSLQPGAIVNGVVTLLFSDGTPRTISVLTVVAPSSATPGARLEPQATSCSSPKLEIQFRTPSSQATFTAQLGKPTTIEVQVVDDCGNLIGPANPQGASVNATFSNRDADVRLTHVGNGVWTGTWRPVNSATGAVTVTVTAFYSTGSVLQSGSRAISGTLTGGVTPIVPAGGVVHAASDAAGVPIAPGSLITIYGTNLANAQGLASTLPLPQQQNGAQVLLGSLPLPILYTSEGQLNVQVPYNTPVDGQYQITVQRDNLLSVPEQLVIAEGQPGVFTVNQQGTGQGVIFKSDGVTLAQTGTPATTNETVVIYCTGLGVVSPAVPEGTAPPSLPLSNTVNQVTVTIGGQDAMVSFSGLTPGFPGLYQVNAVVPPGVSGDAVAVVVSVAGQTSPPVTMAIQ
jgi:uncharacterized protein (TIGR03437 family)